MMRKVFSVALMALAFGWVQSANAGITMDVVFQDATAPTGITIYTPGVWVSGQFDTTGTGCGAHATGYCMDVLVKTGPTDYMANLAMRVGYDSDNGLAVGAVYEWVGIRTMASACRPVGGVADLGNVVAQFDCAIPPPNPPPSINPGTYRIGTIVWDTTGVSAGTETIAAFINDMFDGVGIAINGNSIQLTSADIIVGTHVLTIIPEPGTASLLGLGLVGLILAGRRSRA